MTGTGMDPLLFAQSRTRSTSKKRAEPEPSGNLFAHVPTVSPDNELLAKLVAIANELEQLHTQRHGPLYGVTIGEVLFEAEKNRGISTEPPASIEDKGKRQRAHSGLHARVLPRAGFVRTASYRPSPLARQHGSPHRVWTRRQVER